MSELPQFVAQRLAASAAPGEHLPADLLAAFAEQSLLGAEREQLLSHLATCSRCREALWWAVPENEMAQAVVAGTRTRTWFWASGWRWAGMAAGLVVIAGVALLFRGGPGPAGQKMASAPKTPVLAEKRDTRALDLKQAAPSARAETRLEAQAVPPKVAYGRRKQAVANSIASEKMEAKSADEGAIAGAAPAAPPPEAAGASAAKTAPASTAEAGVMIASNMAARSLGKKKLAPPTRWMLSPEGALLRSTDSGKNWQAVPFAGNTAFHAIAVVGSKVWVGGERGALYYSPDDGSQWQALAPSLAGAALTDDITVLSFQDGQHGSLTTATGHTWTTSDGGRTWQKQ